MPLHNVSGLRTGRICFLVGCSFISIACASVYGLLLLGEWREYNILQRVMMIALTAVHAVGAILVLTMLTIRFRIWLDATLLVVFLFFQLAAAIVFTLFNSRLPCQHALGSPTNCRIGSVAVSIGSGVLTALLIIYGFGLIIVRSSQSRIPKTVLGQEKRPSWEKPASLHATPDLPVKGEKRLSLQSSQSLESFYSPTRPEAYPTPTFHPPPGIQRPDSPSSIYSTSTSNQHAPLPFAGTNRYNPYAAWDLRSQSPSQPFVHSLHPPHERGFGPNRSPSPAFSMSTHSSRSSLLPPSRLGSPQPVLGSAPPFPRYGMWPLPPQSNPNAYPDRIASPPPRVLSPSGFSMPRGPQYSDGSRYPTFFPPQNTWNIPPALQPARPLQYQRSYESNMSASQLHSMRRSPSTPIPEDVCETDDVPVVSPYGGIDDAPFAQTYSPGQRIHERRE